MQEFFDNFLSDNNQQQLQESSLYVVSTPIGNLGDITLRAISTLNAADYIICEDARVTGKLLKYLGIKKSLINYNDNSKDETYHRILGLLQNQKKLALVSDAGTPLISDPGYRLIVHLLKHNIKILSVPGACSAVAALSISGLPNDRFLFAGFIPHLIAQRNNFFKELQDANHSLIFFESANRLLKSLELMLKIFGDRRISISREITKMYEENKYGKISDLIDYYQNNKIRGEIVITVAPQDKGNQEIDLQEIDKEIKNNIGKIRPKDLVSLISANYKISKKEAYKRMLDIIDANK